MPVWAEAALRRGELVELAIDSRAWLDFVRASPSATAFHHPAWARTLAAAYGYPAFALALVDGGRIVAGLPILEVPRPLGGARAVALPFTDHCPPLAPGAALRAELARAVAAWARSSGRSLEVRGDLGVAPGIERRITGVRHVLDLGREPEALLGRFDRNVRQRLGRLRRGSLEAVAGTTAQAREAFYRLHVQTRRRLGVPVQPAAFFELLWENVLRAGLGYSVVASLDGRPVAAAVFLAWNGTAIYKYSASDPAYWREAPNHLLIWTALQAACAGGLARLDLGRSDLDSLGLRTFKSEWGAREVALIASGAGTVPAAGPPAGARRLLAGVIRRSPEAVCRAAGRVLYRYFP